MLEDRQTTRRGQKALELEEGKRNRKYFDTAGKATIGIGHLILPHEEFPDWIDDDEIYRIFDEDLAAVESTINEEVLHPLSPQQFDALASLVFNIGPTKFRQSTVLRMVNLHRWEEAADSFLLWNKERDPNDMQRLRVNPGLQARRGRERAMFLFGEYRD